MKPLPNPVRLVWSKAITSCERRPRLVQSFLAGLLWVLILFGLWLAFG